MEPAPRASRSRASALAAGRGSPAHEFDGVLVGSDPRLARPGALDVELGQQTPAPAQRQVGGLPAARRGDDHFLE